MRYDDFRRSDDIEDRRDEVVAAAVEEAGSACPWAAAGSASAPSSCSA